MYQDSHLNNFTTWALCCTKPALQLYCIGNKVAVFTEVNFIVMLKLPYRHSWTLLLHRYPPTPFCSNFTWKSQTSTHVFIVSPELWSVRDYVITHSVRSMYHLYMYVCMYVCRMYVVFCRIDHCIHIHWCIPMGLGHNDPWVQSHMWPQQTWGQRSSGGQWPLVQVIEKRVTVSTYFDVFSNLILQWLQKYVIAKAGKTCGSRTTLFLKQFNLAFSVVKFYVVSSIKMTLTSFDNFFLPDFTGSWEECRLRLSSHYTEANSTAAQRF